MRKMALLASTVILMASQAFGQGVPQPVQVVAAVLELSSDQVTALATMLAAREQALGPSREQLQARHQALAAALDSATPDAQIVGQLVIDIRVLEQQMRTIAAASASQFEEVLTATQRERLQHIRAAARVCPAVPAFEATGLL